MSEFAGKYGGIKRIMATYGNGTSTQVYKRMKASDAPIVQTRDEIIAIGNQYGLDVKIGYPKNPDADATTIISECGDVTVKVHPIHQYFPAWYTEEVISHESQHVAGKDGRSKWCSTSEYYKNRIKGDITKSVRAYK